MDLPKFVIAREILVITTYIRHQMIPWTILRHVDSRGLTWTHVDSRGNPDSKVVFWILYSNSGIGTRIFLNLP